MCEACFGQDVTSPNSSGHTSINTGQVGCTIGTPCFPMKELTKDSCTMGIWCRVILSNRIYTARRTVMSCSSPLALNGAWMLQHIHHKIREKG